MTTADDDLDRAESRDGGVSLSPADEERILERTLAVFRGRTKGLVALNWLLTAVWGAITLWAASAFFRAATTRDWILYATVFLVSFMAVGMLKVWFWMEMNRYTHTREIKRLELQVARIVQALQDRRTSS
jgi:hypothetical protein